MMTPGQPPLVVGDYGSALAMLADPDGLPFAAPTDVDGVCRTCRPDAW
jgi:hypothetical protein